MFSCYLTFFNEQDGMTVIIGSLKTFQSLCQYRANMGTPMLLNAG